MMQLICISNRRLCSGDLVARLEAIAASGVDAIVLREKDLSPNDYAALAEAVFQACHPYGARLILHSFWEIALIMGLPVQLSYADFCALSPTQRQRLSGIGVSVHSTPEAIQAANLGADWLIAGHIFPTSCKPDLPPRGLSFLQELCQSVSIPVYAIGGITPDRIPALTEAGAAGCCVMSALMESGDPKALVQFWRDQLMHG